MKRSGGMVWRCDSTGNVLEVVSTDFPELSAQAKGQLFYQLLTEKAQTAALLWFKGIAEKTSLLNNLSFLEEGSTITFSLGATQSAGQVWLFWTTTPVAQNPNPASPTSSAQPWEPDQQHVELLEELSRVNNELVNARRELIRQNIELHRAHQKATGKKIKN